MLIHFWRSVTGELLPDFIGHASGTAFLARAFTYHFAANLRVPLYERTPLKDRSCRPCLYRQEMETETPSRCQLLTSPKGNREARHVLAAEGAA